MNYKIPKTQYTKSGSLSIAYQVFGEGNIDLVYIPGWISNIDLMWACPDLVNFFTELGKMCRVILFDKRGTGLSDRMVELSTLEDRMEDINSVMNAVKSKKAILFGHSEGGSVSALFSATYPEKVISLITFGIFAKRRYSKDYPWAPTNEERKKVYDMIENNWCSDEMQLQSLAPSKANDKHFMNWLTSYFRSGASPSAALKLTKMNTDVNIVDILKYIHVPTLIMQRTNDVDVKIEEGRFISERIKKSKFVEFKGNDHLFWVGNTEEILYQIKKFINENQKNTEHSKGVKTVLFGQINRVKKSHIITEKLKEYVQKSNGEIIHLEDCCFAITFKAPGKAIKVGLGLQTEFKSLNASIKIGVYMKETPINGSDFLNTDDKKLIKTMLSKIDFNTVFVTETIKNLLSGATIKFTPKTSILNSYSKKICKLFTVRNEYHQIKNTAVLDTNNDTFLEDLISTIESNMGKKDFGIVKLCLEIGISERQLQRKTKEFTTKSPSQLITLVRLNKAREALLTKTHKSIIDVAFHFGFSSPSYFSKCFKKEFGVKPTTFLKEKTF